MNIAFIGYNRKQTIANFKSFAEINKSNIIRSELHPERSPRIQFKDGSTVFEIFPNDNYITKIIKFDYVILSDDSRFTVLEKLDAYDLRFNPDIPEEFRYIYDNIDETNEE